MYCTGNYALIVLYYVVLHARNDFLKGSIWRSIKIDAMMQSSGFQEVGGGTQGFKKSPF